jgi:hypothetical protein
MTTPVTSLAAQISNASQVLTSTVLRRRELEAARSVHFCHFTIAHSALKSRSFHRQCLPLAEAGFEVSYVSPADVKEHYQNIEFIRLSRYTSPLRRAFSQGKLLITLLRLHADIYHFQDPQLLPVGLLLKLIFRKCVIYDAYEDFPSMAANKAALPRLVRPFARKATAAAESVAAHCLDAIMTADPLTLRRLARIGRSRKIVFYNFPNLDIFPRLQMLEKHTELVYRGGLSERAGTFVLLDALQRLTSEGRNVRLLLIGYSDSALGEEELRRRIAAESLTARVEIRGRIPHEEMAVALGAARIGICPLQNIEKFRINIPVKIFEYWACGLPVIASDLPPSRPFLRGSNAAELFPAGDSMALARAIAHLLDHPDEAKRMGERGRAIVEQRLHNGSEIRKLRSLCSKLAFEPLIQCVEGARGA